MIRSPKFRAVLLVCACTAAYSASRASDAPTGGDPRTRAFVLSNIYVEGSGDAGKCEAVAESGVHTFLKTLPAAEQAKYATPDKAQELWRLQGEQLGFRRVIISDKIDARNPIKLPPGFDRSLPMTPERAVEVGAYNGFPKGKGKPTWSGTWIQYDSCTDPQDFPQLAKGHRLYTGKVGPGMDLDGKAGKGDLVGLDGSKGVDNQLWKAIGCIPVFRDEADPASAKDTILSTQGPTVIAISDLDDIRNDPDVTVDVYGVRETAGRDARGKLLAGSTFTPAADPKLHTTLRGRIVDGVLTTDAGDIAVQWKEQILDLHRVFRGARVRMTFQPDGTVTGGLYGYYDLASLRQYFLQRTQSSADFTGYSCPGIDQAVNRLADGYRDPATGRNTAISSAFGFVGVRAFVNAPDRRTASREAL